MPDFTIKMYFTLVNAIISAGYTIKSFEEFITTENAGKVIVFRHDVDRLPRNAEKIALLEKTLSVKASYFFRIVPNVWNEKVMKAIVEMGHELAYHYEDLSITKGDYEGAIKHFEEHLTLFRRIYPVRTICMHGSPYSKWDNRGLWNKYDYRSFGIIAEPYFDVDYSRVFYITDTGRAWNKESVNVRDTVKSGFNIPVSGTAQLIHLFKENRMPDQIIINTHTHRWFNLGYSWLKELVFQNVKNQVKRFMVKTK
jgi:hypothetical protein